MLQDRINSIAIIYIENEITRQLLFDEITDDFVAKKP
jgi:hypothetical protein